ncbi:MAG: outer membrane lipoprotein-sorting protein, partial [Woeseiaceae bacterium]|nr:outer membrane lipoprotein-sorting protein [Woeseiaceae bacterium]
EYDHRLLDVSEQDGIRVYEIESIPHEEAAVVWGKEVLEIREDYVVLRHRFYDQDGELVKVLNTLEIGTMDDRTVAVRQRMIREDAPDAWTEIQVNSVDYDVELPDNLFTLSNLRNPRN